LVGASLFVYFLLERETSMNFHQVSPQMSRNCRFHNVDGIHQPGTVCGAQQIAVMSMEFNF